MALYLSLQNDRDGQSKDVNSVLVFGPEDFVIGRAETCDWVLKDPARLVSARHCVIRKVAEGFALEDLSSNGTYVNGSRRRLQSAHLLSDGASFSVGCFTIGVTKVLVPREADLVPGRKLHEMERSDPVRCSDLALRSADPAATISEAARKTKRRNTPMTRILSQEELDAAADLHRQLHLRYVAGMGVPALPAAGHQQQVDNQQAQADQLTERSAKFLEHGPSLRHPANVPQAPAVVYEVAQRRTESVRGAELTRPALADDVGQDVDMSSWTAPVEQDDPSVYAANPTRSDRALAARLRDRRAAQARA